jgi:hypothetical protein
MTTNTSEHFAQMMYRTGMLNPTVFAGCQPDIMRVPQRFNGGTIDGRLCDHDCLIDYNGAPTGGGYKCNSSKSLNPGIEATKLASPEVIVSWLKNLVLGQRLARDMFLQKYFRGYCQEWEVKEMAAEAIYSALIDPAKKVELNIFGGNPEMHPKLFEVVSEMQKPEYGAFVNVTTTGRQLISNKVFVGNLEKYPPNVIALSFDDLAANELRDLNSMSLSALKALWQIALKNERQHGQRHKAFEAVYAARVICDMGLPTKILFNMVIHPGNVDHVPEMVETIGILYPKAVTNPYHAQGSMDYEHGNFPLDLLYKFDRLNDWLIIKTLEGHPNINKRLHYYLFMKAIFIRWREHPEILVDWITGHEAWKCFRNPGAARYVQLGGSPKPWADFELVQIGAAEPSDRKPAKQFAGGHLGCFWNEHTVTLDNQLTSPEEVSDFILGGAMMQAVKAAKPCPGCIMPRLIFDVAGLEQGMSPELKKPYLDLRMEYARY